MSKREEKERKKREKREEKERKKKAKERGLAIREERRPHGTSQASNPSPILLRSPEAHREEMLQGDVRSFNIQASVFPIHNGAKFVGEMLSIWRQNKDNWIQELFP